MNKINRRDFIKLSIGSSSIFILGINPGGAKTAVANPAVIDDSFSPNVWLKIDSTNNCTITIPETELGQGIYTGIASLVADELDLDWSQVKIERADSSSAYGFQATGGSTSIRSGWLKFREAGAIARHIFIEAAARKWNVKTSACLTESGTVYIAGEEKRLKYSELIAEANQIKLPENITLKNPEQFKIIGKNIPRIDFSEKVTGKAVFGIDIQLPDMLIATTVHPPVFGAKIGKINDQKARNISGLVKIFKIDNAVAVIAKDYWSASKAAKALQIEWIESGELINDESIAELLQQTSASDGAITQETGDINASYNGSKVIAEYSVPLQAHATMEPMNCTVHIHNGMCEIWAPTQSPSAAKETAEHYYYNFADRALKKIKSLLDDNSQNDILVHTTYTGGGFGRRLKQDFVAEAVQIATQFSQPVKLIWSREEDMQHDRYRPMALCKLEAGLDEKGYPVTFLHHITSPSIRESLQPGFIKRKKGIDSSAVEGASYLPYEIENHKVVYHYTKLPVPLGYWRSVGYSINIYHTESFIDELAHKAGIDSYKYRAKLLQFNPRLLTTLEAVAKLSNWKQDKSAYYGIACYSAYGSHVSQVAKIIKQDNGIKLAHIYCVVDCGLYVNPDIIKAQLEGAIIFGMSSLFSEINITAGRVQQSNFHDFPVMRYQQAPEISCDIIQSSEDPGGIGELGVPPAIPAIINALFAATGKRVRHLPLDPATFI